MTAAPVLCTICNHPMPTHDAAGRCAVMLPSSIQCPCGLPANRNPIWPWSPR
jgi:hypothetical protein